jgi:hypothetical protein
MTQKIGGMTLRKASARPSRRRSRHHGGSFGGRMAVTVLRGGHRAMAGAIDFHSRIAGAIAR